MATTAIATYATLRKKVKETLLLGQEKIEREKVRTYWETGRRIREHILYNKDRAEYGQEVIARLSKDLQISETLLRRCVRFAEAFPIRATWPESEKPGLSWSHYRELMKIPDEKRRFALANRASRLDWGAREIVHEVKRLTADSEKEGRFKKSVAPLIPRRGTLYTYRLVRSDKIHPGKTDLRVDLGFSDYIEALMKGAASLKAGEIAVSEWVKADTYRLVKAAEKTEGDLFTYYAYVERVVDGDTLLVQVDLGFGCWTRQYLRLRGIDTPELDTNEGKRAKKFVESELAGVPYVVITSSRSDKYDRYLADIFYMPARDIKISAGSTRATVPVYETKHGEQFLNHRLLKEHLAERV